LGGEEVAGRGGPLPSALTSLGASGSGVSSLANQKFAVDEDFAGRAMVTESLEGDFRMRQMIFGDENTN
jgi:hypothetical protein